MAKHEAKSLKQQLLAALATVRANKTAVKALIKQLSDPQVIIEDDQAPAVYWFLEFLQVSSLQLKGGQLTKLQQLCGSSVPSASPTSTCRVRK